MSESYGLLYKNRPDFDDLLYHPDSIVFIAQFIDRLESIRLVSAVLEHERYRIMI